MSFHKLNLCASTQVAMDAFHMLRNNTVNLRGSQDEDCVYVRIEPNGQFEGEDYPSSRELELISRKLSGDYSDVKVYDIVHYRSMYEISDRRVDFTVPNLTGKTILTLIVRSMYIDGDEVSGQTAWHVVDVSIQCIRESYCGQPGKNSTEKFRIISDDNLTDNMMRVFNGSLYQTTSDKVTA
jgi:hypothetical protein